MVSLYLEVPDLASAVGRVLGSDGVQDRRCAQSNARKRVSVWSYDGERSRLEHSERVSDSFYTVMDGKRARVLEEEGVIERDVPRCAPSPPAIGDRP